jgi:hypothetical protein
MMQLKLYTDRDQFHALDALNNCMLDVYLNRSSKELEVFGLTDLPRIEQFVARALKTFSIVNLPTEAHFKHVFVSNGLETIGMWRLSDLAFNMVVLCAEPSNALIAQAQLEFSKARLR